MITFESTAQKKKLLWFVSRVLVYVFMYIASLGMTAVSVFLRVFSIVMTYKYKLKWVFVHMEGNHLQQPQIIHDVSSLLSMNPVLRKDKLRRQTIN